MGLLRWNDASRPWTGRLRSRTGSASRRRGLPQRQRSDGISASLVLLMAVHAGRACPGHTLPSIQDFCGPRSTRPVQVRPPLWQVARPSAIGGGRDFAEHTRALGIPPVSMTRPERPSVSRSVPRAAANGLTMPVHPFTSIAARITVRAVAYMAFRGLATSRSRGISHAVMLADRATLSDHATALLDRGGGF